jgi:DNA-binding transcriptional LysR family regulator
VRRPSLHQLEVFCKVVELGSMALAAEDLHVGPSSVSMQIQELERRYGLRLLVRGQRRTEPTAAGSALYSQVSALLHGLQVVERQLSRLGEDVERGTLRFTATRTVGASVVRTAVGRFERSYPAVEISYSVMFSPDQAKDEVLNGRAEFALVGLVEPGWPLAVRPLLDEPLIVVHAPGHPLARVERVALEDLRRHVVLLRESPVLGHDEIVRRLGDDGELPELRELSSTEAVKAEAMDGSGVAVLPPSSVSYELANGSLVGRAVQDFDPRRIVFVAAPSRPPLTRLAQAFLRTVQTCATWDEGLLEHPADLSPPSV